MQVSNHKAELKRNRGELLFPTENNKSDEVLYGSSLISLFSLMYTTHHIHSEYYHFKTITLIYPLKINMHIFNISHSPLSIFQLMLHENRMTNEELSIREH